MLNDQGTAVKWQIRYRQGMRTASVYGISNPVIPAVGVEFGALTREGKFHGFVKSVGIVIDHVTYTNNLVYIELAE